ncbi:universal stress protein [Cocleimonas sp. KMM 6892]|uniref:universal stress protein n=1 Tax=unclassified Cocleimonas TaxID=2639732 RepID=UPI002DB82445|nr:MULTISPECIES: universal stress protein [unclassified Cocleimonas]MEB8433536.1 universal stress protein [Cocleimonas sp. KMM 6892]MEC4716347.1 universal stress protein [Cocleimonas sp. KMM 6895]MEC4745760.1 universal stress protein [Cocleimonas sp. KMM 6896]
MYNTIIVPTDLLNEESTIAGLKKAVSLSEKPQITLLHVLEHVPHDLSKTRETMADWLAKSGVDADTAIRDGRTSYHEIIEFAKEKNADLILINSHKPGLGDYLLGSTASKVVRHSPCAVLVDR